MLIQKNKNNKLIEEVQEEIIPEKKKRIVSQKVLGALAIGRKKRQDALELKRKERDEQRDLNKKVRKVNKILKEHFPENEIGAVKPLLKKGYKVEAEEEIKEEKIQKTKKVY